ncbi:hypothetical protein T492DRAFT_979265 [Pavlovales sp. CCMP2436]|nr:hypothetical protein T492DRAFT_979265 [Pavlovales sp. CCMP2436]
MAAHSPRALRHLARSTERRVRVFNFGAKLALVRAATSPLSDVLHLSGMSQSHVGRDSKGSLERRPQDGLDGAASPFKARGARPSRGRRRDPYRAHRAPRVPQETLDRSSVRELAAARSPAGAHAVRHDLVKFGVMILEIARDPASGRSDSRALLSRRTVAPR